MDLQTHWPRAPRRSRHRLRSVVNTTLTLWSATLWLTTALSPAATLPDPFAWPAFTRDARPGAYWWWLGSAVDRPNLTRELERYHAAGLGAVHVIPIYGAKGWEDRYLSYLSPEWLAMLRHTVTEADRLHMNVDMTTGTGWCFGGPAVTDEEANASVAWKTYDVAAGSCLLEKLDARSVQSLAAFGPDDRFEELTARIQADGSIDWTPADGPWRVYAVSQKPSGQRVKRAAPGGAGHMLNLIYPQAMTNYLRRFEEAFANFGNSRPRAQYHDSYEYRSDWAPDFFVQFERRRGYRLERELSALFASEPSDRTARVKCDYRETISDILTDTTLPLWAGWARRNGFLTRNEAHGSPGNWLDLYATADIPETEMFHLDRSRLISKFASSAAHVGGKRLVACETGTWLKEHFTETLADMKFLLDDLFLSGVNHIFYHGSCYSPDEAGWPGWLFYASYEMNPRNSIWRDVPALNGYATRCQSVLQDGRPDNDLLLYWPIHDLWHSQTGLARNLTVHARGWFEEQPFGQTASNLWNRGYAFDYVSDRQLTSARAARGTVRIGDGTWSAIVVPPCEHLPLATFSHLLALAEGGATIIFEGDFANDVPGWANLEPRRADYRQLRDRLLASRLVTSARNAPALSAYSFGRGRVLVGDLESALAAADVSREPMFDRPGMMCIRRAFAGGHHYFIANRSEQSAVNDWVSLARPANSVVIMDPLTGRTGKGALRRGSGRRAEVFLQLPPGGSVVLRTFDRQKVKGPGWQSWEEAGAPAPLAGNWQVRFVSGGPELPGPFETTRLASWTELGDANAQRFAGTARYRLTFDRPEPPVEHWQLDLGEVCQSARVRLNGEELGTLFTPPFRVVLANLKPTGNQLEIEVTSVAANRIRDLDRRGVVWRNFHDINFVNIDYRPFDASNWPLTPAGLLGAVRLTPLRQLIP